MEFVPDCTIEVEDGCDGPKAENAAMKALHKDYKCVHGGGTEWFMVQSGKEEGFIKTYKEAVERYKI